MQIVGNTAEMYGAATVVNSTMTGNIAGYGGAIASLGSNTILNSTIIDNDAVVGGGIYCLAGSVTANNSVISLNWGMDHPNILRIVCRQLQLD